MEYEKGLTQRLQDGDRYLKREKCPEMKTIRAGDESQDLCKFDGRVCSLVGGNKCDIYDEYQLEEARLLLGVG